MRSTCVNKNKSVSESSPKVTISDQLFFQPKLTINQPGDSYEQEADAVADKVMRMTDKDIVQAKFFQPAISTVQRKCSHCEEEEKKLQRKEENIEEVTTDSELEGYVDNLSIAGKSLPGDVRSFFEPRMGYDLSNVKVHTDAVATKSASSINALAYTSGNNIVFNQGQYSPDTDSGKKLLAHELTHVVQQNSSIQPKRVQRNVSPQYNSIKERLSFGFFNWIINDIDAHKVLEILKPLNETDLRDTVAAMQRDGLLDVFFSRVSDSDAIKEAELLQKVQNYRTHSATFQDGDSTTTVSSTFSCTIEQGMLLFGVMTKAQKWLDSAIARLNEFLAAPGAPGMQDIRDALQMHVHTVDVPRIRILLSRLQAFKTQMFSSNNIETECTAPTDNLCKQIAAAYVRRGTPNKMRLCPGFFSTTNETWQIEAVIHEVIHAFLPNSAGGLVTDRAYADERVYEFLTPEEAFDNSDSIAMLVQVLAQGKAVTGRQMGQPQDNISDCGKDQLAILRPAIARAARWNLYAVNLLAATRKETIDDYADLRRKYFGSDDVARIPDIMKVYQDARSEFKSSLNVKCETAGGFCSAKTASYYRTFMIFKSDTLHVCPAFFTQSTEDAIRSFLTLEIMYTSGMSDADASKYADFAMDATNKYWKVPTTI